MTNGALIGVPIPAKYEAVGAEIQRAVDRAVIESEQNGMSKRGKDVTPWILNRVSELTQGKSIESSESTSSATTCTRQSVAPTDIALLEETALVGESARFRRWTTGFC
jgi:pseudouridylate synthase / pseudouridine kinase